MFSRFVGADMAALQVGDSEWAGYVKARTISNPIPSPELFPELQDVRGIATGKLIHDELGGGEERRMRVYPVRPGPGMEPSHYIGLRRVAPTVHPDLDDLLVAGHETGRRGDSFMRWLWGDLDLAATVIWRRELDKQAEPSITPLSSGAVAMLAARCDGLARPPRLTDAVFPATPSRIVRPTLRRQHPTGAVLAEHEGREAVWRERVRAVRENTRGIPIDPAFGRHLLDRAFRALGRRRPKEFGFHSLRRKFVTDLQHEPPKVVATLGGWRDLETMARYLAVTEAARRKALAARRTGP
jgi:hypothetical protein